MMLLQRKASKFIGKFTILKSQHNVVLVIAIIFAINLVHATLKHPPMYHNEFITLKLNQSNWTNGEEAKEIENRNIFEEAHIEARSPRQVESKEDYYALLEEQYNWRFKPAHTMPRLFWHKFPHKQQNEPTTSSTTTTSTEAMTTTETEPTTTEEIITTPEPETTTPKPTKKPRPTPTYPIFRPITTPTTVMRPSYNHFLPKFGNFFKNILLLGSPDKLNLLWQKRPPNTTTTKNQAKGFLNLFEVIKFENTKCSVEMGDIRSMDGICYHEFECKSLGGIPTQPCAEGVGVCCIFLAGCGATSEQSIVYFESPNYPKPVREMMICVLIVNLRKNVQQLRLDFIMFEVNRPTDGDCMADQFIISGQNMNFVVPILCGINTGQHMYIHVGDSLENKIYLSFFAKVATGGRSFHIKITQLEDNIAPDNCLQYYTEPEGIIKSFNYDIQGTVVDNPEATYFNNLNYAICLQRQKQMCSVVYTTEYSGNSEIPDFQIINKDKDLADTVSDGQAGAGIYNCPNDYISVNSVRLCGERLNDGTENEDYTLNSPIRDVAAGPIILPVHTDEEFVGRGFRLIYKQELCM